MNVSGIVITTSPDRLAEVRQSLINSGLCEVHFQHPGGRIVVTIEGSDTDEEIRKMREIMNLPGVLTANLAYTCNEEEFAEPLNQLINRQDAVPESLTAHLSDRERTDPLHKKTRS